MNKKDKKLREEIKKEFDSRFNNETYQLWKENRKMEAETTCDEEVWYFIEDKILSKVKEEIERELKKIEPIKRGESGWVMHPDWISRKQVQEILEKLI